MQRGFIIVVLGIGAIVAGLASKVDALPNPQPQAGTQNYTLSGDSLRGLETREANKDSSVFFPETSSNSQRVRNTVLGEVTEKRPTLNIPVEVRGGTSSSGGSPSNAPLSQQANGDSHSEFSVRYRLNE